MSQPMPMASSDAGPFLTTTGEVMVVAVIFLFVVALSISLAYLYANGYRGGTNPSLGRFVFAANRDPTPLPRRLDAAVLESLPVTVFCSADLKEGLECAVCLTELSDGEEVRLLPKCRHGFHVQCIDMWFHSHSTCPLCRSPVVVALVPDPSSTNLDSSSDSVAVWQPSTSMSTGILVIEIPRRMVEVEGFPTPISTLPSEDEMKTPPSTRLRSLTMLLSASPRGGGDIEQGIATGERSSPLTPTTPTSSSR